MHYPGNDKDGSGALFDGAKLSRPELLIAGPDQPGGKRLLAIRKSERVTKE